MLTTALEQITETQALEEAQGGGISLRRSWDRVVVLWRTWSPDYRWWDALSLSAIYLFLLYFIQPSLMLEPTTTSGGDTGSHHYIATFMRDHLLPRLTLSGWSPDWYAGLPMLTFYFPLPYILMALGSYLIPYTIAFKLVSVLGIFLLPASAYLMLRLLRFPFPLPAMGAVSTIPFLFLEQITPQQIYSIYGGNIPSTLAGEFNYSIGLSFALLFTGVAYRAMDERRYLIPTAFLLAATSWTHLLPTGFAVASSIFGVVRRDFLRRGLYLMAIFALAFGLSALWTLPFLAHLPWMVEMKWAQITGWEFLAPEALRPYAVFGVIGAVYGIRRMISERDTRILIFLGPMAGVVALYFLLPDGGSIWNARFLPFLYINTALLAAYGLWGLQRPLILALRIIAGLPRQLLRMAYPLLFGAAALAATYTTVSYIPGWLDWNYSGFEKKAEWSTIQEVSSYLDSLPPGRVMVEYAAKYDRFGTPRVFELIPYFARQPTMEGLLVESSITSPFHFYMQAEVSEESSKAVQGVEYPAFDFEKGLQHLDMFNIRYFLAATPRAKQAADAHPQLVRLTEIKEFTVYELPNPGYVSVIPGMPALESRADWRDKALSWFKQPEDLQVPIVFEDNLTSAEKRAFSSGEAVQKSSPFIEGGITSEQFSAERIEFRTTRIGQPHLVRVSYFPNWKVAGADGPYLASPSFMVVVPRQEHVVLYYGRGPVEWAGLGLSLAGLAVVLAIVLSGRRRRARPADSLEDLT